MHNNNKKVCQEKCPGNAILTKPIENYIQLASKDFKKETSNFLLHSNSLHFLLVTTKKDISLDFCHHYICIAP